MTSNQSSIPPDEFSCFINVSDDTVHESEWLMDVPDEDFDTVSNGYGISVVLSLYFIIGLPWNIVVIGIIIAKRLFTQPALMLMLNLAVTNCLIFVVVMPFNITTGIAGEFVFGSSDRMRCSACKIGIALIILPIVSAHTLSLMAVDRFIYLKKPVTYSQIVTPGRMLAAIVTVWGICIVLALPPLFAFGDIRFSHTVAMCVAFVDRSTHIAPNFFYIVILMVEGVIPYLTLFIMYFLIIHIVRRHLMKKRHRTVKRHRSESERDSDVLSDHSRSQLVLVHVFGAIFTANIITWLPLIPLVIAVAILESGGVPTWAFTVTYLSYMSSTVIHPILESCLTHEIRASIKGLFCRTHPRDTRSSDAV